jgi:hypothetical protein
MLDPELIRGVEQQPQNISLQQSPAKKKKKIADMDK